MGVIELETLHFPPHVRPVTLVEIKQRHQFPVTAVRHISLNEMPGQGLLAVVVQVHRQESDLGSNVAVPEAVVKLDTIKDADTVFEADVGGVEVTVTVFYPSFFNPFCKK